MRSYINIGKLKVNLATYLYLGRSLAQGSAVEALTGKPWEATGLASPFALGCNTPLRGGGEVSCLQIEQRHTSPCQPKVGWLIDSVISDSAYLVVSGPPGVSEHGQVGEAAPVLSQTWADQALCLGEAGQPRVYRMQPGQAVSADRALVSSSMNWGHSWSLKAFL